VVKGMTAPGGETGMLGKGENGEKGKGETEKKKRSGEIGKGE